MAKSSNDHHNDGQADGASGNYTGTLTSGRDCDEQQAYNDGYAHGKGQSDAAEGKDFDLGYVGNSSYIAGRNS